jgi:hypothetical protein
VRLRTGAAKLNSWLAKTGRTSSDLCPEETIDHVLLDCPAYISWRPAEWKTADSEQRDLLLLELIHPKGRERTNTLKYLTDTCLRRRI